MLCPCFVWSGAGAAFKRTFLKDEREKELPPAAGGEWPRVGSRGRASQRMLLAATDSIRQRGGRSKAERFSIY